MTDAEIRARIRKGRIRFAGNRKLKIYGFLHCTSGMRMKRANRVFFKAINEAEIVGYRPCGHCMRDAYRIWKKYRVAPSGSTRSGLGIVAGMNNFES